MSQGKLRKRNKTGCSVLTKSATKTISKRTQAESPDCGQCAWAAARWPNASEQRQKLTENLTNSSVVPEPPPRVSEGGSSFLTNQKIIQSCRATRGILRVCVRKQIQAEASQKGGGAAHLAPQSLLPVPAALRWSAGRRKSQKEAGSTELHYHGARRLRGYKKHKTRQNRKKTKTKLLTGACLRTKGKPETTPKNNYVEIRREKE